MSNSNYLPQQQVTFPENFIVILIHGWTEKASDMNNLVNTMRGLGSIESYWNCVFPDITITKDDLPGDSNVFSRIQNEYNIKANANVFIKIAFTNEEEGPVIEQSEELADVIEHLREVFPTKKIATVGYSKGGVVAMECAVDYPDYIDNLISVATPYTTTIAEHLYGFVVDCLQSILNGVSLLHILNHPAEYFTLYVLFATNTVENLFRNAVNNVINGKIVMPNLRQRWNQMTNHPSFTPIATRALTITNSEEEIFESDFVVPVESALADGFYGKKYSDDILLIRNQTNRITVQTSQYTSGTYDLANLITKVNGLTNVSTTLGLIDFFATFFPVLFSIVDESNETKIQAAKYAHANLPVIRDFLGSTDYALKNEEVAWRVLAGLK